tara:strand:+ start:226 stop:426 length:201 start_codon:yes stop_codon:yes gene_type:complete
MDKYAQLVEVIRKNVDKKHIGQVNLILQQVENYGFQSELVHMYENNMLNAPSHLDFLYSFCSEWDI